jgi:alpha-mannosidase
MEREAPDVFAAIVQAVKAGRWHVTGGMWTEGDTNLSSGEALARSFLLAQRYFHEKLGVTATCGWLPDNFGHTAQLPQLMRQAGITGFYHMRCSPKDGTQIYWWEAPDGSRVLAKTGVVYGGSVTPDLRDEPARLPPGITSQMIVYGVGDHGGGPTRKDITAGLRFADSRLMPQVRLSPAAGYFDAVRPTCNDIMVHKGELNFTLTGCYTSVAAVKQGNRDLENALQAAEAAGVAGATLGKPWPGAELTAAWKTLAFNQFHDVLPGSAIHESNVDSVARYNVAIETATQVKTSGLRAVADAVAVPATDGVPLMVWNSLAWSRSDIVVAEVVLTERFHRLVVLDDRGAEVASQVVRTRDFDCDFHVWVQFFASDVPGLGYRTYTLKLVKDGVQVPVLHWFNPYPPMPGLPPMSRQERSAAAVKLDGWTVTNPFFELAIDRATGGIAGLRRLRNGRRGPQLLGASGANRLAVFLEAGNKSSAWVLDPAMKGPVALTIVKRPLIVQEGPESVSWQTELAWGASRLKLQTTVHADSPRIDCCLETDWLERGGPDKACPMLGLLTSVAGKPRRLACDVPFAVIERTADQEVPSQKWADLAAPGGGLALFNSGKYGHRLSGGVLRLGLLRSFHDPDVLPDVGRHVIRWALLPHDGDWRDAGLPRLGLGYNVALEACQLRPQKGTLPLTHSFASVEGDAAFVVTGVKQAEDGQGIILRGYDSGGRGCRACIRLSRPVASAQEVSILEEPWSDNGVTLADGVVCVQVKPAKVVSVRLR